MKALFYNLVADGKKVRVLLYGASLIFCLLRLFPLQVACVAHTGVAATLLPKGTTAHRYFRIPLTIEDTTQLQIELESPHGRFSLIYSLFLDSMEMNGVFQPRLLKRLTVSSGTRQRRRMSAFTKPYTSSSPSSVSTMKPNFLEELALCSQEIGNKLSQLLKATKAWEFLSTPFSDGNIGRKSG